MKAERIIPNYEAEARGVDTRGRDIMVYPKEAHLRSTEEKWGVRKHRSGPISKRLLVLGTGRCGTMFTTKALQTAGIPVLHEKVGEAGTVSHYFVADSDWYPMAPWQESQGKKHVGERRSDYAFDHVLHIVRDPRKAIPSMTKIFGSVTWKFYEENGILPAEFNGKDPVIRAMAYWYFYNRAADTQAEFVWSLERYQQSWPAIMEILGENVPYPAHLKPMNKTGGFKKYTPMTFDQLIDRHASLGKSIRTVAKTYGYGE